MENVVVDKNDSFDDEFDFDDDFPSFDDDDEFNFSDDDDADEGGSFDFSDSSDDEDEEEPSIAQSEEPTLSDDTYQFEELSEEAEVPELTGKKKANIIDQIMQRVKNEEPKKLIIYGSAAFFLLVMIVFFIMSALSPAPKPTTRTAQKRPASRSQTQTVQKPSQQTPAMPTISPNSLPGVDTAGTEQENLAAPVSATGAPSFNQPVTATQVAQPMDDETKKMIKKLSDQNAKLTQQIQTMQNELSQASGQYNNLAQQIQSTNARVTNIERSIANVEGQMSKVGNALDAIVAAASSEQPSYQQPTPTRQRMASGARITYQAPASKETDRGGYFIQAIIPGRAWIKNSAGQTITVTYGDTIAGFGKVTKIDAENGVVDTSSGVKIMYGINEG